MSSGFLKWTRLVTTRPAVGRRSRVGAEIGFFAARDHGATCSICHGPASALVAVAYVGRRIHGERSDSSWWGFCLDCVESLSEAAEEVRP